jgi:hypothetical protein
MDPKEARGKGDVVEILGATGGAFVPHERLPTDDVDAC